MGGAFSDVPHSQTVPTFLKEDDADGARLTSFTSPDSTQHILPREPDKLFQKMPALKLVALTREMHWASKSQGS